VCFGMPGAFVLGVHLLVFVHRDVLSDCLHGGRVVSTISLQMCLPTNSSSSVYQYH